MTRTATLAFLALSTAACNVEPAANKTDVADQQINDWIVWKPLPDQSFGYTHKDETGTTSTERCWQAGKRYQCIFLGKLSLGEPTEIAVDTSIMIYSYYRDRLTKHPVYPENGYSCSYSDMGMGLRREIMSTASGASVENMGSVPWTRNYVANFFTKNDPSNGYVYFSCEAVSDFLHNANEAAFLTSEMTARRLNLDLSRS